MNTVKIIALLTYVILNKNKGHSLKHILTHYATENDITLTQSKNNYYIALNKYKTSKLLQERLKVDASFFDYTDYEYFSTQEVTNMVTYVITNLALNKSVRKCMFELSNGDSRMALRLINKYRSTLLRKEALVYSAMLGLFRKGKAFVNPYTEQLITPRCSLVRLATLIGGELSEIQLKQLVLRLEAIEKCFNS